MLLIIYLLFAIHNTIEAKLEAILIQIKNPSLPTYASLNKQEHRWSAIFYLSTLALVAILYGWLSGFSWKLLPVAFSLLIIRRLFFDYGLKAFRKRPFKAIEGDQWQDNAVRKVLGANGGYKELFLLIVLLTASYFLIKLF